MTKIDFRVTTGCQPYLYDCWALPQGKSPIEICSDCTFAELITHIDFLIDPMRIDCLTDIEFAEHLVKIARSTEYTISLSVCDVEEYLIGLK